MTQGLWDCAGLGLGSRPSFARHWSGVCGEAQGRRRSFLVLLFNFCILLIFFPFNLTSGNVSRGSLGRDLFFYYVLLYLKEEQSCRFKNSPLRRENTGSPGSWQKK